MWVCKECPRSSCYYCATEFDLLEDAIEHVRKHHFSGIRRPGAIGNKDSHGHIWYCFDCDTGLKDHRSFDSDEAMLAHLNDVHGFYITGKNDSTRNEIMCSICYS